MATNKEKRKEFLKGACSKEQYAAWFVQSNPDMELDDEDIDKAYKAYIRDYKRKARIMMGGTEALREMLAPTSKDVINAIPDEVKMCINTLSRYYTQSIYENLEFKNNIAYLDEELGKANKSVEQACISIEQDDKIITDLRAINKASVEEIKRLKDVEQSLLDRIAELEKSNEAMKVGNQSMIDTINRIKKQKIKFVMMKPGPELDDYIHDLEERNDTLMKENNILQEYLDKHKKSEEELHLYEQMLQETEEQYDKVKSENLKLRGKIQSQEIYINSYKDRHGSKPIIVYGDEDDVYSGEVKDLILRLVADKLASCDDVGSRQYVLLSDILEHNPKDGTRDEIRSFLFDFFKKYRSFADLDKSELAEYGLEVRNGGKHAYMYFKNNPNITTPISLTPSDGAHMQNLAQTTAAKLL